MHIHKTILGIQNSRGLAFHCCSPFGTFNNDLGMDDCDACSAGQYSNTLGAKWCKVRRAPTTFSSSLLSDLGRLLLAARPVAAHALAMMCC